MKKTVTILTILSVLALLAVGCEQSLYAQFKIPKGYSEVYPIEDWGETKRIYIDFDGDGKKDTATIIAQQDKDYYYVYYYSFLIYLTSDNKNHIVELSKEGNGHCLDLEVKSNVIQFGVVSGGTGLYAPVFKIRYNHTKRKIQLIGFDYSYRISGHKGNCQKSYNLLTGDYNVTNYYNVGNPNKVYKEFHKGNKKMKAVFIENINEELIGQLISVGNEFENHDEIRIRKKYDKP